ncbi:hypothetical protein [Caldalkalibacillus mannanilyticus]|uniref:hypothetical protein n=1 Tax=Caldalkalibacillus mannanilyticus TaxID=1418 RepID=UPI00046AE291|nr:hypothetical protein [Caldalkalibacillus mannanilyticus]
MKYFVRFFIIILLLAIIAFFFYAYTETYGLPWKRAEVKREAIIYMKEKYNMDVEGKGCYNFKFNKYFAKVYNVLDENKNVINVKKYNRTDEKGQYLGVELSDNYSIVYWENEIRKELAANYPRLYQNDTIDKIFISTTYGTRSLEEGVSNDQDENGVFIPLKPDDDYTIRILLTKNDFSDDFLQELLTVVQDPNLHPLVSELYTSQNSTYRDHNDKEKEKYILLTRQQFKDIHSIEDLKKEIAHW